MISEDALFLGACLMDATHMICAIIAKDMEAYDKANNQFLKQIRVVKEAMMEDREELKASSD